MPVMKKSPFYWYLILPALYAGIMLFFALIQFRDTESESYAMGPMIFTADRGSLETDESLSGLRVTLSTAAPLGLVLRTRSAYAKTVLVSRYSSQASRPMRIGL
jgi:hypothetical protein